MVKATGSSYGSTKYKPWRKGQSSKAKKGGSLKQQLRGCQRLFQKEAALGHDTVSLQQQIQALEEQIQSKQTVEQERQFAKESHGPRFLDRQRLTRRAQKWQKQSTTTVSNDDWMRLALDFLLVAHHPPCKYLGVASLDTAAREASVTSRRKQRRRAAMRKTVLEQVFLQQEQERCKWLDPIHYQRVQELVDSIRKDDPNAPLWSLELERTWFGKDSTVVANANSSAVDARFATTETHEAVLQADPQVQATLDRQQVEKKKSSADAPVEPKLAASDDPDTSDNGSDNDSDDDADPLQQQQQQEEGESRETDPEPAIAMDATSKSVNSDQDDESDEPNEVDSDHDDDDDDDDMEKQVEPQSSTTKRKHVDDDEEQSDSDSSDSDSSSSDSDSSNPDDSAEMVPPQKEEQSALQPKVHHNVKDDDDDDEVDDFLVEATDETPQGAAFSKQLAPWQEAQGDKSKGWATQRQRPGQFRKKRTRR